MSVDCRGFTLKSKFRLDSCVLVMFDQMPKNQTPTYGDLSILWKFSLDWDCLQYYGNQLLTPGIIHAPVVRSCEEHKGMWSEVDLF